MIPASSFLPLQPAVLLSLIKSDQEEARVKTFGHEWDSRNQVVLLSTCTQAVFC